MPGCIKRASKNYQHSDNVTARKLYNKIRNVTTVNLKSERSTRNTNHLIYFANGDANRNHMTYQCLV